MKTWPTLRCADAAERLHGGDTAIPLLTGGGTKTARLWTYVRDDRHFGGTAPPAVAFRFSRDRSGGHLVDEKGIFQADAHAGYSQLYDLKRLQGPVLVPRPPQVLRAS